LTQYNFKEAATLMTAWMDEIPQIERSEISTLWSVNHYDGPATGTVEWQNKRYYAVAPHIFLYQDRVFLLIDLPDSIWKDLDKKHQAFEKYVGMHCNWTPDGQRIGKYKGNRTQALVYYKKYPPIRLDEKSYPVIGWFIGWTKLDND